MAIDLTTIDNDKLKDLVPLAMLAWVEKYNAKNRNYGNSWLLAGQTLQLWFPQGLHLDTARKQIINGLITRMLDKIIRAAHLELAGIEDEVGERASETFFDLGVYGFMAGVACNRDALEKCTEELTSK